MKMLKSAIALVLLACLVLSAFSGCKSSTGDPTVPSTTAPAVEEKDYAAAVKLNMKSETAKQEVTVKLFVDGDTTHFNVPTSVVSTGLLKARYLAIDTPESTGKIEEYGKTASAFTKEKLSNACSIVIESDDENWNLDSTGGRYLVWVWYKTSENDEYRNLNIEILQNGLAAGSKTSNNRYGDTAMAALTQARALKKNLFSGEKDPNFFYGDAYEVTLKELRANVDKYNGTKVAFEGVITVNDNNGVYIEEYDPETDCYYGIYIFYGYGLTGDGLEILEVGNRSRIVGSLQYYEAGGTYQVAGLTYRQMKPNDPGNIQKISSGNDPAYALITADQFLDGKVTVESEEGEPKVLGFAEAAVGTTVSMKNLKVNSIYTTQTEGSSSYGAMTLNCTVDGRKVSVRTTVLLDDAGKMITEAAYKNKTIDVRGIIDYYNGSYQIKVFSQNDITIVE